MSQGSGGNRPGLRTIRAVIILAGFLAFLPGIRIFGRSYSMTRWPITPGRVTSSATTARNNGSFDTAVSYEYILSGRVRQGRMPLHASSREAAESLSAQYPAGKEIAVGYDPGNPNNSVLRPRIRWWSLALTLAGACLMAAGLWPRKS